MEATLRKVPLASRIGDADKENSDVGRCIKSSSAWLQMREVERLRQQLAQEESRCAQAEAELRRRSNNRGALARSQEECQQQQESLHHGAPSSQLDPVQLREECSKLSDLLSEARREADAARSQSSALKERAECAESQLRASRTELDENKCQTLENRAQGAEQKLRLLEQAAQHTECKCQAIEERAKLAELRCQTLVEERECLEGRCNAFEGRAACAEKEVRFLKKELVATSLRAEEAWQAGTAEEGKRHQAEIQQLSDECLSLRAEKHESEQLVESMKQASCKAEEENRQSIEALQLEIQTLRQECERLSRDAEAARKLHPPPGGLSHAELLQRNRELLLTIDQFKQDCEAVERENASLQDSVASFEQNLERVADQNAQLIGHVNHKQKIRYTMKLKDENLKLREELRLTKRKAAIRDVPGSRCEGLFEALAAAAAFAQSNETTAGCPLATVQRTALPAHAQPTSLGKLPGSCGSTSLETRFACVEQRCEEQERALESVRLDFLHLRALIERAVSGEDPAEDTGGDIIALLQRLRRLVAQKGLPRQESLACANEHFQSEKQKR